MGIFCILGLFQFFNSAYTFNSNRAKVIIVNGLIYHGFSLNHTLHPYYYYIRNYDILSNTGMIIYTVYHDTTGLLGCATSSCIFLLNSYVVDQTRLKPYFTPIVKDVIHVLFVQRILANNLYMSLH